MPRRAVRRYDGRECCILSGVEDPFDFQALRIQRPGKLLPNRANYEIFNDDRQLPATVTETEGHTRLKRLGKSVPDTRTFAVTTAAGEPVGFLIKQSSEWITEFRGPGGELIGRIRTGDTRRIYTLLGDQDQAVGKVTGDLALKHFSVTGTGGAVCARVRDLGRAHQGDAHAFRSLHGGIHRPGLAPGPHADRHDAHRAGPDPVRARVSTDPSGPGPPVTGESQPSMTPSDICHSPSACCHHDQIGG